jgi:hypothetical protein
MSMWDEKQVVVMMRVNMLHMFMVSNDVVADTAAWSLRCSSSH